MRGDCKDESVQEDIAFWKRKDSLFICLTMSWETMSLDSICSWQYKESSRSAEPGAGEGRTDSLFMLVFALKNTSLRGRKMDGQSEKNLSFVISKFAVQSFLLPRFHNSL